MYVWYSAVADPLIFLVPGICAIMELCPAPFDEPSNAFGLIFRECRPTPSGNQLIGTGQSNTG